MSNCAEDVSRETAAAGHAAALADPPADPIAEDFSDYAATQLDAVLGVLQMHLESADPFELQTRPFRITPDLVTGIIALLERCGMTHEEQDAVLGRIESAFHFWYQRQPMDLYYLARPEGANGFLKDRARAFARDLNRAVCQSLPREFRRLVTGVAKIDSLLHPNAPPEKIAWAWTREEVLSRIGGDQFEDGGEQLVYGVAAASKVRSESAAHADSDDELEVDVKMGAAALATRALLRLVAEQMVFVGRLPVDYELPAPLPQFP
ncbi:hypothetical protein H9P43_009985 [Blastocladiella emersonii ATCC 22665]|nr:hypothetical protein H9P43_009985 [Blastocladiella emersonii ATCC 22665]